MGCLSNIALQHPFAETAPVTRTGVWTQRTKTPCVVGPILVDWPFKLCHSVPPPARMKTKPATYPPSYLPRVRRHSLFCQCSWVDIYIKSLQLTASKRSHAAGLITKKKEKTLNPSIMNIQLLRRSFWICTDDPWCNDDLFIGGINQARKKRKCQNTLDWEDPYPKSITAL